MRKVAVFIVLVLYFSSCTRDPELLFDENRQLIVQGQVTSSTDLDLTTIPISVTAFRSAGWFTGGGDFEVLGNGFPDASGNYKIVSTFPKNADEINLEINSWRQGLYIDSISQIDVYKIENLPLKNSKYSIPALSLDRLELFEIEVRRKESHLDTLIFSITYSSRDQRFSIDKAGDLTDFDSMGGSSSKIKPEDTPRLFSRSIIEDTDIFIFYAIRNNGIIEQGEFIIPTDGLESRFVFEY